MSYRDFEERFELVKEKVNANKLVELAFERKIGKIRKIRKEGNGKNTFYVKKIDQ